MKKKNRKEHGFSLIELLIAMAVVLILVGGLAIAGERSLQAGRETSAAQTVQTFAANETTYQRSYGGFSPTVAQLGTGVNASCNTDNEMPATLATAIAAGGFVQGGYTLTYTSAGPFNGQACGDAANAAAPVNTTYDFIANPVDTKTKSFCADSSGTFYLPAGQAMVSTGIGCLLDNAAAKSVGQ